MKLVTLPLLAKRASVALMLTFAPLPLLAQEPLTEAEAGLWDAAWQATEFQAWDIALTLAEQAEDPLLTDLLRWRQYQSYDAGVDFESIAGLVEARSDWPQITQLRLQAERRMTEDTPEAAILAWHEQNPPLTYAAIRRYAEALENAGESDTARAMIADRWPSISLNEAQQASLIAAYPETLGPEAHWRRLNALLAAERHDEAERMLPLVSEDQAALARARLLLQQRGSGVDAAIRAVPEALQSDEGLLLDRLRWRRNAGQIEGVIALLDEQPEELAYPQAWWTQRSYQAREAFHRGDHALAYRLAAEHGQTAALPVSEAEWLAGWMALRFLDDPEAARTHFEALYEAVGSPISLARGAYWAGRAAAALSDEAGAAAWYERAAEHPATFYGQLAAVELGEPAFATPPADPELDPAARAAFNADSRVRAVRALLQIDREEDAEIFLTHVFQTLENAEQALAFGELALELENTMLAVRAGKRAAADHVIAPSLAYPTVDLADAPLEAPLVLAIIRTESEFNQTAVSSAGARGLMQLMPATAEQVARGLDLRHEAAMLTEDPDHNLTLGSTYLADRVSRYGGSWVLAAAAYNAGAGRADEWIRRFGDPRGMELYDVIDWIESIPFMETRNYVQRVMETVGVYRAILEEEPGETTIADDLLR